MHHVRCITCGASPVLHHLRCITCSASPAVHHLRWITCSATPSMHHIWCITCRATPSVHHIWCIIFNSSPVVYHPRCNTCGSITFCASHLDQIGASSKMHLLQCINLCISHLVHHHQYITFGAWPSVRGKLIAVCSGGSFQEKIQNFGMGETPSCLA